MFNLSTHRAPEVTSPLRMIFLEAPGVDALVDVNFRYLLPIGLGEQTLIHTYYMDRGLIDNRNASGAQAFNPLISGRSYFTFRPYYRNQIYDEDKNSELLSATNGLEFGLEWDNRDFLASPSRGEHIKFAVKRDFGWLNSDSDYWIWEFSASKYFSLPTGDWSRQQVLALNFYTADTPSWDRDAQTGLVTGRAPDYMSPKLGGYNRLRAYPFERFNDRSAIYYGLEYRVIPQWNPLSDIGFIQRWLAPDWWQVVPFAELGRVAPTYDWGRLHTDMKWDVGIGLRFMLKKTVVRVDYAVSEESTVGWVMFDHPF